MHECGSRDDDIARAICVAAIYPEARAGANGSKVNFVLCLCLAQSTENSQSANRALRIAYNGGSLAALLNHFGYQAGPSGLMIGAEAGAIVAVKKFVKKNQVAPVRIALEYFGVCRKRDGGHYRRAEKYG